MGESGADLGNAAPLIRAELKAHVSRCVEAEGKALFPGPKSLMVRSSGARVERAMAVYGKIHQVADFVARSVSKGKAPFTHEIIEMLKAMSAVQESNALITLAVQTGDGLRVVYEGLFLSLIVPQHKHVRVLVRSVTEEGKKLRKFLKSLVNNGQAAFVESGDYDYWRISPGNVKAISSYFETLTGLAKTEEDVRGGHPRYFSGAVREAALAEFERNKKWCAGVNRPRHKVDLREDRIAFDHILPWSRGGGSSASNIQVLCEACNLQKRATASGNAA